MSKFLNILSENIFRKNLILLVLVSVSASLNIYYGRKTDKNNNITWNESPLAIIGIALIMISLFFWILFISELIESLKLS
jgi:hypothetical protein